MAQDDDDVMIIEPEEDILKKVLADGKRGSVDSVKKMVTPTEPPKMTNQELAESKKDEGNKMYRMAKFFEAEKLYSEAIALYPEPSYFTNRCQCYIKIGNYERAASDASEAISLDKTFVKGYLRQAKSYILLGKLAEARTSLQTALVLEKAAESSVSAKEINDDLKTIEMLEKWMKDIDSLWNKKDWRAVIYYCGQVLEKAPALTQYSLKKAHAMIYHKQVAEGQNLAIDALRHDARNVDALFVRGLALFYDDNMDKALEHFKQALTFAPDHANSMSYFKKIKSLKQKKEEAGASLSKTAPTKQEKEANVHLALKIYKECLEIEPLNGKVNSRLHFNISICYGKMNQFQMSLDACNQAIALDSEYEKALLKKVQLMISLEMFEEAVREAESVHKKFKSNRTKVIVEEARGALKKSKHKDYYKILGVDKMANEEEIKKAYKKMAMVHHPDRHSNATEEERKVHEKKFKDLGEAYAVLSDRTKKMRYDNGQDVNEGGFAEGHGFPAGFDPNDIFATFFQSAGGSPFGTQGAHFTFGSGGHHRSHHH